MRRLWGRSLGSKLARDQRGVALAILLAFMALAVPFTIAALEMVSTLSLASRVQHKRLVGMYSSGAGMEAALWQLLNDPTFDEVLTPANPSTQSELEVSGQTITVIVTKVFPSSPVEGQGLAVSKEVTPDTASPGTPTTFTYTITIKNVGTGTAQLNRVDDYLPPGFTYVSGSTGGDLTTSNPNSIQTTTLSWYYLNDAGSLPYPWDTVQGSASSTASHTPAQSSWETVSQYWETVPFANSGTIPAATWTHQQRISVAGSSSSANWRVRVQRVRGGVPTDLFTSPNGTVSTIMSARNVTFNPGDISIQAGDSLRLRLEVYSSSSISSDRRFDYNWGGGSSSYLSRTEIPGLVSCAGFFQRLGWPISGQSMNIPALESRTLTFQATATLSDGTYYNQASARYAPWWDTNDFYTYSPYSEEVTVGSGEPTCGYSLGLLVSKAVDIQEVEAGEESLLTYTVSIKNVSERTLWVCDVQDWLPPGFNYGIDSGSHSGSYYYSGPVASSGAIDRDPHRIHWEGDKGRHRVHWRQGQWPENGGNFAFSVDPGQVKTFSFQATAILELGMQYFNEIVVWYDAAGNGNCFTRVQGGAHGSAFVKAKSIYDVAAVAPDGTVLARVKLSSLEGTFEILSWQQY